MHHTEVEEWPRGSHSRPHRLARRRDAGRKPGRTVPASHPHGRSSRGPRCERRRRRCEEWRRGRCGTSERSRDEADRPAPPQPSGQQGFASASFVGRRQRCPASISASRLAGERRSLLRGHARAFQQPASVPRGPINNRPAGCHPAPHFRPGNACCGAAWQAAADC
jgi:hypothetical protein